MHRVTTDDVLSSETREKLELHDGYVYVCVRWLVEDASDDGAPAAAPEQPPPPPTGQLHLLLFTRCLVTVHERPLGRIMDRVLRRAQTRAAVHGDWVLYLLLDEILNDFRPQVVRCKESVMALGEHASRVTPAAGEFDSDVLLRIGLARGALTHLHHLLYPKREVLGSWLAGAGALPC